MIDDEKLIAQVEAAYAAWLRTLDSFAKFNDAIYNAQQESAHRLADLQAKLDDEQRDGRRWHSIARLNVLPDADGKFLYMWQMPATDEEIAQALTRKHEQSLSTTRKLIGSNLTSSDLEALASFIYEYHLQLRHGATPEEIIALGLRFEHWRIATGITKSLAEIHDTSYKDAINLTQDGIGEQEAHGDNK